MLPVLRQTNAQASLGKHSSLPPWTKRMNLGGSEEPAVRVGEAPTSAPDLSLPPINGDSITTVF